MERTNSNAQIKPSGLNVPMALPGSILEDVTEHNSIFRLYNFAFLWKRASATPLIDTAQS